MHKQILTALTLAFTIHAASLFAREIPIAVPSDLNLLNTALPGDVFTLKNGVWTDAHINIKKGGSAESPLVIRAETPGQVVLNGSSSLEFNAPHATVEGLLFSKGAIKGGAVIAFKSDHGTLRNTAVVDYNPAKFETRYYWVYFHGNNNLVDHCYFKGKNHDDPLIGNHWDGSEHNTVSASYIKDIPYVNANGREDFRIWGYGRDNELGEGGAFFTIKGNLLDHADGEGEEVISLKSNRNRVIRNTILATRGGINLRAGNFNTVQDNIILGKGVPGSSGIRMSGQNLVIKDNYVSGCEFGIRVSCGEYIEKNLTGKYVACLRKRPLPQIAIPAYGQVKNLMLSGNVLVGIKEADLDFGARYKVHWPKSQNILLPESCQIENNRFIRPKGGVSVTGALPDTDKDPVVPRLTYQPNKFAGNVVEGGEVNFVPAKSGFTVKQLPLGWTEAREVAKYKPLTSSDVGPDWARNKGL